MPVSLVGNDVKLRSLERLSQGLVAFMSDFHTVTDQLEYPQLCSSLCPRVTSEFMTKQKVNCNADSHTSRH